MIEPYGPEVKAVPRNVGMKKDPIFIIGQNIGHEGDGSHTGTVWEKNKSALLVNEIIGDRENLFLTNICNYTVVTPDRLREGIEDIKTAMLIYGCKKVICLGSIAYQNLIMFDTKARIVHFAHPSFIIRFNKDRDKYIRTMRGELDS